MRTEAVSALRQRMIEELAQALCGHAEGPYPQLQAVRCVPEAVP